MTPTPRRLAPEEVRAEEERAFHAARDRLAQHVEGAHDWLMWEAGREYGLELRGCCGHEEEVHG